MLNGFVKRLVAASSFSADFFKEWLCLLDDPGAESNRTEDA